MNIKLEDRLRELNINREDFDRAIDKFCSSLSDEEIRIFVSDMNRCCSSSCGCK